VYAGEDERHVHIRRYRRTRTAAGEYTTGPLAE